MPALADEKSLELIVLSRFPAGPWAHPQNAPITNEPFLSRDSKVAEALNRWNLERFGQSASREGTASWRCILILWIVPTLLALACLAPSPAPPSGPVTHRQADPSTDERYCAWYGAAGDGVLYFGQAAFWSATRTAGDNPRADLLRPGPRLIGRFDLERRELLEPLRVGPRHDGSAPRSGIWDVLPVEGRVYFTTYFEEAGYVEPATGAVTLFPDARYWNELALGPVAHHRQGLSTDREILLLASRYADAGEGGGAVVLFDPDGRVVAEHALGAPPGVALAAKTPAFDPVREEIWVTTDRLPIPRDENTHPHPTLVLDLDGHEVARFGRAADPSSVQPEIQFVRFDRKGLGYLAVARGSRLELVILEPETSRRDLSGARSVLLDDRFAHALDFAQDIQIAADGSAWVTRWSGRIHQVTASGKVRTWNLPRADDALYYTAVPAGADGSVCATRCGDVEVVCTAPARKR